MEKMALIVLDIQAGIVGRIPLPVNMTTYLEQLSNTLKVAREARVPVIQVTTGFRSGNVDLSAHNKAFARLRGGGSALDTDASTHLHPWLLPEAQEQDIQVRKRRVSAFHGTDLEVVLRTLEVRKIVLAGLATSGAVLSTLRQAADLEYEISVVRDLCADGSADVHRVPVDNVFPKQASVVESTKWVAELQKGTNPAYATNLPGMQIVIEVKTSTFGGCCLRSASTGYVSMR